MTNVERIRKNLATTRESIRRDQLRRTNTI